jgi:hypothetical protein
MRASRVRGRKKHINKVIVFDNPDFITEDPRIWQLPKLLIIITPHHFRSAAFLKARLSLISLFFYMIDLFKEENIAVAKVVIGSVVQHLRYLKEEVVVLSIFYRQLDPVLEKVIVVKLLYFPHSLTFSATTRRTSCLD